jgi:1,4-dihydroxy-2-naphthoyl-CoA synthase
MFSRSTSRFLGSVLTVRNFSHHAQHGKKEYKMILSEIHGKVGLIRLNRPKALNALCNDLIAEVIDAGKDFDKNSEIGAIVITGSEKAFAAGADIKEMQPLTYTQTYTSNMFAEWGDIAKLRKPVRSVALLPFPRFLTFFGFCLVSVVSNLFCCSFVARRLLLFQDLH